MGCVLQAGLGQAPARQAAIHAGLPNTVGATTVHKVCGSGLKTVILASQIIRAGDADIIVAGGMENMSQAPYLLPKARDGYRLGHGELLDSLAVDAEGNVCVATIGNGGITVFSPKGEHHHVPTDDILTTNICFGGDELRTAWITLSSTGRLVRCEWETPGLRLAYEL